MYSTVGGLATWLFSAVLPFATTLPLTTPLLRPPPTAMLLLMFGLVRTESEPLQRSPLMDASRRGTFNGDGAEADAVDAGDADAAGDAGDSGGVRPLVSSDLPRFNPTLSRSTSGGARKGLWVGDEAATAGAAAKGGRDRVGERFPSS